MLQFHQLNWLHKSLRSRPQVHPDPNHNLPTLKLPSFDGVYTNWPAFHDACMQINRSQSLTANQKFQYLHGALNENVKSLIRHLTITGDNYETAWNDLIKRYNNKRALFNHHMEKLFNLPTITKETSNDIELLYSTSCVFGIEKLGINRDESEHILAFIVVKELPQTTREKWEQSIGKSDSIL